MFCFAGYMETLLQDASKVQAMFLSLMQNESSADGWVSLVMDSTLQTVTKVHLLKYTELYTFVTGVSLYYSYNNSLLNFLVLMKKALMGHVDCPDLADPWAWISTYSSVNPELWAAMMCPGNGSHLEDVLKAPLIPLMEKVNASRICKMLTQF